MSYLNNLNAWAKYASVPLNAAVSLVLGGDPDKEWTEEFMNDCDELEAIAIDYAKTQTMSFMALHVDLSRDAWFTEPKVYLSEFGEWAQSLGYELPEEYKKLLKTPDKPAELSKDSKSELNLPPKLQILIDAYYKFWTNADPGQSDTHITNDPVADWLREKGFSKQPAEAGATIIRPEWAAKGRRPEK